MNAIPEKWVIKVTPENKPILQQYTHCNKDLNYNYTINTYYGNKCLSEWMIRDGEIEITIEYFMKYIVNKELFKEDLNHLTSLFKKLKIK